jgi:hypothetical protein
MYQRIERDSPEALRRRISKAVSGPGVGRLMNAQSEQKDNRPLDDGDYIHTFVNASIGS